MSKKQNFKLALIDELTKNKINVNDEQIDSALSKLNRFCKNMHGVNNWDIDEDVQNAICFYHEYKKQNTFNRNTYNNNR
jgi:hypothetical protein